MRRSAQDVVMDGKAQHEDEDEHCDTAMPINASFCTPRRRQRKNGGGCEFSVTPEPSRRRLSTSKGRKMAAELEESPARYSPGRVKKAVRSFADFLHFLKQDEHHQEYELMPLIIQRFSELGAVIESQKRHIDRWKGKELDLAIEEAQQNMELVQALGERIQKQELEIAESIVKGQQWEEKYQLAAQEIEILKKQGTYQIQQLRSEVAMLRHAGVEVEKKLKERETSIETQDNALLSQMKRDSEMAKQENTKLKQQIMNQLDEMHALEQQISGLRDNCEAEATKAIELEHDVTVWQEKYQEKTHHVGALENALSNSKEESRQRAGDWEQLIDRNHKLQEHVAQMAQEHEKQLADQHKYRSEAETERQRLAQALEQESLRCEKLNQEVKQTRAQIEAQAMAAMKQREHHLLDEKARVEQQFGKINEENIQLRASVENLKNLNRRKSTEIGELLKSAQDAEQLNESRKMETQTLQQLTEEAARAKHQVERLSRDIIAKDTAHDEAIRLQSAEFENQYTDFVSQVENQFKGLTQENEQLRAKLEETGKKLELLERQSAAEREELSRWQTECEKLQHQVQEGSRENESLKRELEHRLQELEVRNTENAELSARIKHFLSSDHGRTEEIELLQGERLRLEERNLDLQRLLEETRAQAESLMEEAHRVHNNSVEQQATHENAVRSLYEEKEAMHRNLVTLVAEKAALEAERTTDRSKIEHWMTSVQLLEHDKRQVEYQLEEVMLQATEQIETQKQSAAMVTQDGQSQLQKLTSQLVQRDAQINEGHQQLRNMQETIRLQEKKLRTQQHEVESLHSKNEKLANDLKSFVDEKRKLERILRQNNTMIMCEDQSGMEEDICKNLEQLTREMDRRVKEEKAKAVHSQAVLNSKLDTQMSQERAKLVEENARLQQHLESYAAELEKLDSELLQLQQEREERDQTLSEMQQTIAAYEEDQHTRKDETDAYKRLDDIYKELTAAHEQLKLNSIAQLKEKEKKVTALQDDMSELRSKLEQEKEMTRHLMESSDSEKLKHAQKLIDAKEKQQRQVQELEASLKGLQYELRASEQSGGVNKEQLQAQVKELEELVQQLQHELQVSQQAKMARDQSVMHENLQKEREYRALQVRCDNLTAENAATHKKMEAKLEEIDHLHEQVGQLHEEIERLHEEIKSNTVEMDSARSHLHVSEQLTQKLVKLQDDLAVREDESCQHDTEMFAKDKELQRAHDTEDKLKRQIKDTMHENEYEANMLKQKNAELREQLNQVTQAKLLTEAHTAAQEIAMRELEQAHDQSVEREQELSSQVAHLEATKTSLLCQFRREMRKLNIEFGAQGAADSNSYDDSAFHRGILEVSALLQRYQEHESYQDALIHRKEKQINELKVRLEEVKRSIWLDDSRPTKRDELRGQKDVNSQIEAISGEVSKLQLENQELRDNRTSFNDKERNSKWEERCTKLINCVRDLKNANAKLKENHFSKADMKALVKKVEKLTNQAIEKDMQLQTLREASKLQSKGSTAANGPRRPRDLLEEKVMVLNDHLTGLMTENMQLRFSIEQYAVQYGPLNHESLTKVLGNCGVGVPARSSGTL